jgi:type I restriction enzyme S subunit
VKSVLSSDRSDWEIIKIPEVLFFQGGPGVRKWQFTESGVKLLNVGNINKGKLNLSTTKIYLSEEEAFGKYAHFLVDADDLLIACSGIVLDNFHNKITFAGKEDLPLCLNTSTMRFKALDKNKIDLNFFKYFLQTQHFNKQLSRLITGSAQLNFGPSHIKKIDLFLPPLAEQQKIAEILDAADALRQKDQQLIDHYTTLSQSLFLEMFGDPVTNPMGWEVNQLKDMTTAIMSGNTPKGGSKVYADKGILFLRSQNVWKNKIDLTDVAFLPNDIHQKMQKTSLKNRDILITKTGRFNTENSSLGRSALFEGKDDSANLNGHVYLIRMLDKKLVEFVVHILTTDQYRDYIRRVCVGGIDKRQLNKTHLEEFPIISPPFNMAIEFVEQLKLIHKQKQQAQASLVQSNNLFNSLLQKAFTGELTA